MTIKHRLAQLLPDKIYLQIYYRRIFGRKLNLKEPKTFNEKIQWLKLYDRNPTYSKMVDKYEAKNYVENKIGKEYIINLAQVVIVNIIIGIILSNIDNSAHMGGLVFGAISALILKSKKIY